MKRFCHLCFSAHTEALFRAEEDYRHFLNLLAIQSASTGTAVLADAEMSDHVHLCLFAQAPAQFAGRLRESYTKYFNSKYGRGGRMGEKGTRIVALEGTRHICTALTYTLRNGLHHGLCQTAFGYPYCSIHQMFASELGFIPAPPDQPVSPLRLPQHVSIPPAFRMDATGTVVRSSFMEIAQAESFYGTPRNFLYQMNRLSDERWAQEQGQDDPEEKPFILTDAEPFIPPGGLSALLENERGFRYDRHRLNDLQVCKLIDRMLSGRSIYQLSSADRNRLANTLYKDHHLSKRQIIRCLALDWTRK